MKAAWFSTPRPVYELYDLKADPSELRNLSGNVELAAVENQLRTALAGKMIQDFDYLPLPQVQPGDAGGENRAKAFRRLDSDGNGNLSAAEFAKGRQPEDAAVWFKLRDKDANGIISRKEYLQNMDAKQR